MSAYSRIQTLALANSAPIPILCKLAFRIAVTKIGTNPLLIMKGGGWKRILKGNPGVNSKY